MAGHAKTLTFLQKLLVLGIMSGLTHVEAGRRAGYKDSPTLHNTVAGVLKLPQVAKELKRLQDERLKAVELSAEWWRREIAYQYERVRDAPTAGDALRALELAGKSLGIFDSDGDRDLAERQMALMDNMSALMALQVATQAAAKAAGAKTVDAEAHAREVLGLPASQGDENAAQGLDSLDFGEDPAVREGQ